MTRLVFDIEADGFLDSVSKIHVITIQDVDTGEVGVYSSQKGNIAEGLRRLEEADNIIGHNIIGYDIPVIKKLYPDFAPKGRVLDTIVMSGVIYADLKERDWKMWRKQAGSWIPVKLFGNHSLEAWGMRMGFPKDDYTKICEENGIDDPWGEWNEYMERYCVRDVEVTLKLLIKLEKHNYSEECLELEHSVAWIIARQCRHGVRLDVDAASKLYAELKHRQEVLGAELRQAFPPWEIRVKDFIPKRDNKAKGYKAGVPIPRYKTLTFNPNSEDHVAHILKEYYGWKPKQFTDGGKPTVSEEVLSTLIHWKWVPEIIEYMMVTKRISQLAEGNTAWLKMVGDDGRIHGRIYTNGTVTGRMAHTNPNMGQVPRRGNPYGAECRALFIPGDGRIFVGCDADGLELRIMAHYMARWDDGKFALAVVEGNKDDGTDAHSMNMRAIGLNTRDAAKTFIYAFIYGGGEYLLGTVIYEDMDNEKRPKYTKKLMVQLGTKAKANIAKNMPALMFLREAVLKAAQRGHLKGLDGRLIHVRSPHSSLNALFQSGGAVVMKRALVILDEDLRSSNYVAGVDFEFVLNVHDEFQIECLPQHAEDIGEKAADAIRKAGEYYKLRCPLAGSYAVGKSWCETH